MTEETKEVQEIEPAKPPKNLTLPHDAKTLHTMCKPVEKITPAVEKVAQSLELFIRAHQRDNPRPASLAAPQIGKTIRLFSYIVDNDNIATIITPEVIYEKKTRFVQETCLSISGKTFTCKRGKIVKIRGMGLDGVTRSFKGRGLIAQIFLHEIDHLNGITIDSYQKGVEQWKMPEMP